VVAFVFLAGKLPGTTEAKRFATAEKEAKLDRLSELIWFVNDNINIVSRSSDPTPEDIRFQHVDDCIPLHHAIRRHLDEKKSLRISRHGSTGRSPEKDDEEEHSLLDIGSGGGFPGLVIQIMQPNLKVTMIEATRKKCDFLVAASQSMGFTRTEVIWGRAETMAHDEKLRESFTVVTARAVADLRTLVELCLPFVQVGGRMYAMKGPRHKADEEIHGAGEALRLLGGEVCEVQELEDRGPLIGKRTIVIVRKVRSSPRKYPRLHTIMKQDPLIG